MGIPRIQLRRNSGNPFGQERRPLRVLVDQDLVVEQAENYTHDPSLLRSGNVPILSELAMIEPYFRRADLHVFRYHGVYADELVEPGEVSDGVYQFVTRSASKADNFSIRGFAHHALLVELAARSASDGHACQDECLAAFVLQAVAEQLDADVLLSERPCLATHGRISSRDASICSTSEFIALLGLLLRSRGDWSFVGPQAFSVGPWRGSLIASRALIEKDMLLVSSARADDKIREVHGRSRELANAAHGVFRRISRSLAIRDELHKNYLVPTTDQVGDTTSAQLEWLALNLSGTFDLLTKFVALSINFPLNRKLDLLSGDMRSRIKATKGSPFLEVYDSATEWTMRICRSVRNSIHGAALDDVLSEGQGRRWAPLIELLVQASGEIRRLLGQLGEDEASWGVRSSYRDHHILVEADLFADQLLRSVVDGLNGIIAMIPFEELKGFDSVFQEPSDLGGEFSQAMQHRALMLYGLT